MPAAEVRALLDDLRSELVAAPVAAEGAQRTARYAALLDSFAHDWRQLCALHGTGGRGIADFARLAQHLGHASAAIAPRLAMRTNGAPADLVLRKRVLDQLLAADLLADRDRL